MLFHMKTPCSSQITERYLNKTTPGRLLLVDYTILAQQHLSRDCFHTGRSVGHSSAVNGVVGAVGSMVTLMCDQ